MLTVVRMGDPKPGESRPADRLYLVAIVAYVVLTLGFIAYFVRWLVGL